MTEARAKRELSEGRAGVRRLIALGGALLALLVVGAIALLMVGSRALDDLQMRADRALIQSELDRRLGRMVADLTSATIWDQTALTLRPGGDLKWADAEIGTYFAYNRGADWTVVLDAQDRPFFAWAGEARTGAEGQSRLARAAGPLVRKARVLESSGAPRVQAGSPFVIRSATAAGIVVIDGVPYLAAASTVSPESGSPLPVQQPAVMVISAQRVDHDMLDSVNRLGIHQAHLEAHGPPRAASLVLHDIAGRPAGQVAWIPGRPGVEVLKAAAPALALGALVAAALASLLGWQIVRVARGIDAHEAAHDQALAELKDARDRAESANIAKSQFLANMSHEIRTPLNGVLGMAQVLAKSELAPGDRDKLHVIRASGETLLGLLNDLLDLSKIEAGRMELDDHDFDLLDVVEAACRPFATLAAQKDVRFLIELDADLVGVWRGDGGKLRQVLANLASNAVKFTSAGEIRVAVRRSAQGVACTVADSGAGIARDRLQQLFLRFSQVDPTTTRRFGGTGLGLAISRELVELMGGTIAVTSVEGRGSAFTFDLPLAWVGACAIRDAAPEAEPELPPVRVLAAEDNKTNQLLLTAMLEPMGVKVRLTADGSEALAAFQAEAFDLVLMDVQMPTMNGIDATRAIRAFEAQSGRAPTPILALSANVMRHQIEEYLAAGMNGFVAKPIEMAALVAAIEQALAPPESRTEAA
ncbi:MAG: response regulator [Caulobacterales bacterium]|nr:response regulator [Caulobacterales bacterium]